jgi:serine phosphatase RsbU (regulator of sigma subunit)
VAHEAAELALSALARASKWDPEELFRSCHASARSTRGVVMALSLLDLERGTMTWASIGNVEGVLLAPTGAKQSLVARSGVVGYEVPPLRPATVPLSPGAGLILATDGITSGFDAQVQLEDPPGRTAAKILAGHGRSDDDALVLVVLARDGRSLARGA